MEIEGKKINEEVVCILFDNQTTNQIEIEYVKIENSLAKPIDDFVKLCDNPNVSLEDLITYLKDITELNLLNGDYRYCHYLDRPFQGFTVNIQSEISKIANKQQFIANKAKQDTNNYSIILDETNIYKQELKNQFIVWGKAFAINKTYRLCHEDKSVLTFSHRLTGYSNPVYQLTPNFSVEIMTNFGYGRSSYFFTKLKYKHIEITPFSEWIEYEYAKFSDIIRYTQSHLLENQDWLEAMLFCKEACNLSRTNEIKFVEKYIIGECEKMVVGLEEIFSKDEFSFKRKENKEIYKVNKEGHFLIGFRGEKISGALDFISKITEFDKITAIASFIKRIETCNRKIQPILFEELRIIKMELVNLNSEITILKPKYLIVVEKKQFYDKIKREIKQQMIASKQIDPLQIGIEKDIDNTFLYKYPEFNEFQKEFDILKNEYDKLNEQVRILNDLCSKITAYNNKIDKYFGR